MTEGRIPDVHALLANACSLTEAIEHIVTAGRAALDASGGSAFFMDGATGRLEMVHTNHPATAPLSLALGQGMAGEAALNGHPLVLTAPEEVHAHFEPGVTFNPEHILAAAAYPIRSLGDTIAVFCFERLLPTRSLEEPAPDLGATRATFRASAEVLGQRLAAEGFANALERLRTADTFERLARAASGSARTQPVLTRFVSELQTVMQAEGLDARLIYVNLRDDVRQAVRTMIGGFGLKPSFSVLATHSLDSRDIQAEVLRTSHIHAIAGFDPTLLDSDIYQRYQHHRFARIWIPLLAGTDHVPKFDDARAMRELRANLRWQSTVLADGRRETAVVALPWSHGQPVPFGTVEIGFARGTPDSPLGPLGDPAVRARLVLEANRRACLLREATLTGNLDHIGRLAARVARVRQTLLSVRTASGGAEFVRWYPDRVRAPRDSSAEPTLGPEQTVRVRFIDGSEPGAPYPAGSDERQTYLDGLRKRLRWAAEDSATIALEYHRAIADQYEAFAEFEKPKDVGTELPDPFIAELCREVCRATGARHCGCYLADEPHQKGAPDEQDLPLFLAATESVDDPRPRGSVLTPDPGLHQMLQAAARSALPQYGAATPTDIDSRSGRWAVLPLEGESDAHAFLALVFEGEQPFAEPDRRRVEAGIGRWSLRLAQHLLLTMNRFTRTMKGLREKLGEQERRLGREIAVGRKPASERFIEQMLPRLGRALDASAVMLLRRRRLRGNPNGKQLERFWYRRNAGDGPVRRCGFETDEIKGPCRVALERDDVVVWEPGGNSDWARDVVATIAGLEARAEGLRLGDAKAQETGRALRGLIDDLRQQPEKTYVVCPVGELGNDEDETPLTVTVVLDARHHLTRPRLAVTRELAGRVRDALRALRNRERSVYVEHHRGHVARRKVEFDRSDDIDAIVGVLLRHLGTAPDAPSRVAGAEDYWGLADDAVLWRYSASVGELSVRSMRGAVAEPLSEAGYPTLRPTDHPFVRRLIARDEIDSQRGGLSLRSGLPFPVEVFAPKEFAVSKAGKVPAGLEPFVEFPKPWVLSFPVMDVQRRVWGIVDCFRNESLRAQEYEALREVLSPLSSDFCSTVVRCRYAMADAFARDVSRRAVGHLGRYQSQSVYDLVVANIRDAMRVSECDLYLEKEGRHFVLQASTREAVCALDPAERMRYTFCPSGGPQTDPFERVLAADGPVLAHASEGGLPPEASELLRGLLRDDGHQERVFMALRLGAEDSPARGVLCLRGPRLLSPKPGASDRVIRKGPAFNEEDVDLLLALGLPAERLLDTARLLLHQTWLVRELDHTLRNQMQDFVITATWPFRALVQKGLYDARARANQDMLDVALDLLNETGIQLTLLSSQVDRSRPSGEFADTDITALIKQCCDFVARTGRSKAGTIDYSRVPHGLRAPVDRRWLRKALVNLLDNACKYSFEGRHVEVAAAQTAAGAIEASVRNWGVGIPVSEQRRVFELYYRCRVPDSHGLRPGSGIGLGVVRQAIEDIHRGEVSCTSTPYRQHDAKEAPRGIVTNIEHETVFHVRLDLEKLRKLAAGQRVG